MSNIALHTDQYELTMLDAFVKDGSVNKRATFEVFARSLPAKARYGVFAGTGRLIPMIEEFRFDGDSWVWVQDNLSLSDDTMDYLKWFKFSGTITGYREGELYFPNSPVLTVEGTLGECILLETLILSVLNYDSAIATTAARMVSSAKGRPIIEMGSRRAHEEAALAAARAAYITGFASTSNLAAGHLYGIPTTGTAAHAFTLAHETEADAFDAQIDAQGVGTTLLIDTYNIKAGTHAAVACAQRAGAKGPGAVRIDSGDLMHEAEKVRHILDSEGATDTRIVVSSDLDEFVMKDLQQAPIDGYGVGTKLVSANPAGFVYKLVEIETQESVIVDNSYVKSLPTTYMRPVHKKAKDKISVGGKKRAFRYLDRNGKAVSEGYFTPDSTIMDTVNSRALQVTLMDDGHRQHEQTIEDARDWHAYAKSELPEAEQQVWYGEFGPYITAEHITK